MTERSTCSEPGGSPTKVGFCITELEPGGAERALVELVTRLDRACFEPVVYCLARRPASNPTSLADRLESSGLTVHYFGARDLLQLPCVAARLVRQLRSDRPMLLQTFLFHANVLGAWAARQAGVPHVVTGIRVAEREARWHLQLARWADRYVDRHVCVSGSVLEFSREHGRLPAAKLVVIPNAVDVDRYTGQLPISRVELGVPPEATLVSCIGRLERQKGIDWLLESFRAVQRQEPDCWLLLVGDGPQREALKRQARRLGVTQVRFLGFRPDVPRLLASTDLVVLPSRWEGMPNVVLEAMAAGRALVATDVEGVRELLAPHEGEQVVSRGDPGRFADQVLKLLGDDALRTELGTENLQRARTDFSYAAAVAGYEQLYRSLTDRS